MISNNLLPFDGETYYFGSIFSKEEAKELYEALLNNIEWRHDKAVMFGKKIITKRKVAWYGEKAFSYTYSKITKQALPFTEELIALRLEAEKHTNARYNSCLLNLYHDGAEGMAWHSDGEKELEKHGSIASLSFGAERKFSLKHKQSKTRIDVLLENGSLLEMKGLTQDFWQHRLPPTKTVFSPRINLTFRTINST